LLALSAASCNRTSIEGVVYDVKGAPLPGVTVRAVPSDVETLTDALGHYSLLAQPNVVDLDFMKNGYTSGRLELPELKTFTLRAGDVSLWILPQSSGVYLYENNRYKRAAPLEPERFGIKNAVAFGASILPEMAETDDPATMILCFKMPPYDVRMSKLHAVQAMSSQAGRGMQEAWVQEASIPIEMAPVDEPERLLLQIRSPEKLTPGVYAVHWGALEGHNATDSRMFMFKCVDPAQPEQPKPESPPEPPKEDGKTKTKTKAEDKTDAKRKAEAKPSESEKRPVAETAIDTEAADAEAPSPETGEDKPSKTAPVQNEAIKVDGANHAR
jgi:hypothetical protein